MRTRAILATLLIAAAASADARFAWPYPPKAVSPDEIGHWVVINGNAWSHDSAESKLTRETLAVGRRVRVAAATGPDSLKSSPTKGKIAHVAERSSRRAQESLKRFHVL
jgi:hypothetical protein